MKKKHFMEKILCTIVSQIILHHVEYHWLGDHEIELGYFISTKQMTCIFTFGLIGSMLLNKILYLVFVKCPKLI